MNLKCKCNNGKCNNHIDVEELGTHQWQLAAHSGGYDDLVLVEVTRWSLLWFAIRVFVKRHQDY